MKYSLYMESTPNPSVMKFVTNRIICNDSIEINSVEDAKEIPIIESLFNFSFVKSVFISQNFISIKKSDEIDWQDIAIQMREFILEKLNDSSSKEILIVKTDKVIQKNNPKENQFSSIEMDIITIIDEYIKPAVESDGGNIEFKAFKNGKVEVILRGACSGCPSSSITLKQGIESLLKQKIGDQIKEVVAFEE
jgi:Fe-S cluster biogenesis protein NfuA